MIPYSRPKRSDLYTLSQSKLLENHTLHSGTYLYSPYMAVPPPPGCFLRLAKKQWIYTLNTQLSLHVHYTFCTFLLRLMNNVEHFKRKKISSLNPYSY